MDMRDRDASLSQLSIEHVGQFAVLVAAIIMGLLVVWCAFRGEDVALDKVGLGIGTTVHDDPLFAEGRKVLCFSISDLDQCLKDLPPARGRTRLLWLGWSQLYAINDYHPGDRVAASLMVDRLASLGVDLIAVAMPNINPREELVVYEYVRQRLHLDGLIVAAWLQGTKQEGIRPEWQAALASEPLRNRLQSLPSGAGILALKEVPDAQSVPVPASQAGSQNERVSTQQMVEEWLLRHLNESFPLWRLRNQAQGTLRLALRDSKAQVLRLRNLILGLHAETWYNPIPESRYLINVQAFTDLVEQARHDNLPILVYVPPRPTDAHFPFDPDLYARYKVQMERMAVQQGARFVNLEDCVKGPVWGKIENGAGEIVTDYSHFTAQGHAQLATALLPFVVTTFGTPAR